MALTPNFNQVDVDLTGIPLNNPTSLQFGPDGRLYVSQQDGLIRSFNLKPIFDNSGNITKFVLNNAGGADQTDLVKNIPNHNDDGSLNTNVNTRQVTGLVVEAGPNGAPVLYVSSSDPRIGGGASGNETGLDTNSGIISRLTKQADGSWKKVDLVIGLPRSEENHSTNGLDIRTEIVNGQPHKILYVASGGNTNRGAPSNNFAWLPEYYYSAAILRIDLTLLEQMETTQGLKGGTAYVNPYVYALPTLNDPTRPDNAQGQDTVPGVTGSANAEAANTFGGNNGRNQAKYDPLGIVTVYSMGYRNSYDLVITEDNNIYTFDNGPNNGWGDVPLAANGVTPITTSSQVATNYPNIDINTGNDSDPDNLHLVTQGFYGGHPNPVYASGPAAGLYWVDTSSGSPVVKKLTNPSDPSNDPTTLLDDLPSDWNTIAGGFTHPGQGVYITPKDTNSDGKPDDGSLVTISSSSNGLAEYVAGKITGSYPITNIAGAEVLVTVSFNGNAYFMEIVSDGTQTGTTLTDIEPLTVNGTPLDVNDVAAFAIGTEQFKDSLFITQFGLDKITALVPGVSAGPDLDQDDDGVLDNLDHFQYDPDNGTTIILNSGETLFWDFNPSESGQNPGKGTAAEGPYNIGMTGWMTNGVDDLYLDPNNPTDDNLTDLDNTIRGGAPGIFQIKSVTEGDSYKAGNTQRDALQTGFLPASDVQDFTIKVPIYNPFTSDANNAVNFGPFASMGFALGDGSQSNYIKLVVGVNNSGGLHTQVLYEENENILADIKVPADFLQVVLDPATNNRDDEPIELRLNVNMTTFEAIASWSYFDANGNPGSGVIGTVQLNPNGNVVKALKGEYLNSGGQQSAAAITMLATSTGAADPFTADFLDLAVEANAAAAAVDLNLIKTVSKTAPAVGEIVTFQLTVNNTSATSATGISVKDLLPAGFTYSGHTGGTYNNSTGIWNVGSLAGNSSKSLSISAVVNDPGAIAAPTVLYRVNAGGGTVLSANASQPNWAADTKNNPSPYWTAGSNTTYITSSAINMSDPSLPAGTPTSIFQSERWDKAGLPEMAWAFPLLSNNESVEVRLYFAEIFSGITTAGQRVFDVSVEGAVPTVFDNIDPFAKAGGNNKAFMLSHQLTVTDGTLNLQLLRGVENPALKGIEIISLGGGSGGSASDYTNYAQIWTLDQIDSDSTAGNNSTNEDDDASVAVTVPTSAGDTTPPVVEIVVAEAILAETTADQMISVTYSDAGSGIAASSFGAGDITVTGSSTGVALTVKSNVNVTNNGDGTFTVNYTVGPPGGTWDAADNGTYVVGLKGNQVFDLAGNAAIADTSLNSFVVNIDDNTAAIGSATLSINLTSNNIQVSNFGNNSFLVTNTGDKNIAQVEIDVTNALYPDTIFDPFGLAGDNVKKVLTVNTVGGTGVVSPNNDTYIGPGGTLGYEGIRLFFDGGVNNGFNPGETLGFSIDMDPNSVAGTRKSPLDGGSSPAWDVGGVSGAELIGSTFKVTFTDGTTATGQLQGAGNQAGSQALASQAASGQSVSLTVNGLSEGAIGTYSAGGPSVVVKGPAGATARVVLTKGFIQPVNPYTQFLANQLNALAATDFPANNAVEFQTVDVQLTGSNQNISGLFDFSGVANYNFTANPALPLSLDENKLPLGFVASIIDPGNNNLPTGPVTQPIYLEFQASSGGGGTNTAPIAANDNVSTNEDTAVSGNVLSNDSDANGDALNVTAVNGTAASVGTQITLASGALLTLNANGSFNYNPNGKFEALNTGQTGNDSFTYTVSDGKGGTDTAAVNVTVNGVDEVTGTADLQVGLYDANADTLIQLLQNGSIIQASTLPTSNLTIAATVASGSPIAGQVESIVFNLNNGQVQRIENIAPYALFGDTSGDYIGGSIPLGNNTIAVNAYSADKAAGQLLEAVSINFAIV